MYRLLPILLLPVVACVPGPGDAEVIFDETVLPEDMGFDVDIVGVAVEPETGAVSVLDAWEGLFRLETDGWTQIADPAMLQRDGADLRPFTDAVALGSGQFAVTVRNDGLLVDVPAQTTEQHFCYLPGGEMENAPSISQLTHSITYDPDKDVIFAQPQTFDDLDVTGAQVGTYSGRNGGQPEGWFELKKENVSARAMAWDEDRLLLAMGTRLYTYSLGTDQIEPYVELGSLGEESIQGLALRPDDTLVIVRGRRIQEVTGWRPRNAR